MITPRTQRAVLVPVLNVASASQDPPRCSSSKRPRVSSPGFLLLWHQILWWSQLRTVAEREEWIRALWSNILYANPAKRAEGVTYQVTKAISSSSILPNSLQLCSDSLLLFFLKVNEMAKECKLTIDLQQLRLVDDATKKDIWCHSIQHMRSIARPDLESEKWIIFNFDKYGGSSMLMFSTVTPSTVFNTIQGVILAHVAWKGHPLLKGSYHKYCEMWKVTTSETWCLVDSCTDYEIPLLRRWN